MSTDIMNSLSPLDEMIQLIYQSIYQFVVISSVTHDKWTVHVGMVGDAGRWWRGVWEEKDVTGVVGPRPSEKLLEALVDKLINSIVCGELYLAGFSTEKGGKFELTFGTTSTRPVSMNLEEISPTEAAAHAANVFLEIALQAQSRKCRLHPSAFASIPAPSNLTSAGGSTWVSGIETRGSHELEKGVEKTELATSRGRSTKVGSKDLELHDMEADQEMRGEEKEKQKKRLHHSPEKMQPQSNVLRPKMATGKAVVSLANPTKKARKFQAMEFESDED